MLQPPRGYRTLSWLGLGANILAIPVGVALILIEPHWRTANLAVGVGALLPTAVVGIVASTALLRWRAWGQIVAIVALSMSLALSLPYGIVRMALVSEGRGLTALLATVIWVANLAALVFWCQPRIRSYLV
ncbi:MAG: Hepatitis C virus core protein [Cyanobacteriota bacterium]|nr:Hepatitis C virus core protein [Cyanobacteriota bacterium]